MNLLEMIVDCLKSCGGEASVSDLASAVGKTESEVNDILSSHENFFAKCENGNWKLTPLYSKDYMVASSYIGMEVIHSALISTMSMGHGVVIDAFDNILVVKFANKTAKLSANLQLVTYNGYYSFHKRN